MTTLSDIVGEQLDFRNHERISPRLKCFCKLAHLVLSVIGTEEARLSVNGRDLVTQTINDYKWAYPLGAIRVTNE